MNSPYSLLQRYLTAWNLSGPSLLAETPTSTVYTVTHDHETVVLKILSAYGHEERVGAMALRHFDGRGAVRLLGSDDGAQLMEYAGGEDLTGLVASGQDSSATEIIAGVINALHTNNAAPPEGITTLRRWFQALFLQAEHDRGEGQETLFTRAAIIADAVLEQPQEPRVLHGDIHHENIRKSPRGWLAFDPKGLYGERTYDLANTLCNPRPIYGVVSSDEARILRNAGILAERCGIERQRVMLFLFLYTSLSAAWTLQLGIDGIPLADLYRIADIAERHAPSA